MASDRISELPNSLLSQILSYLPTKLAATTDILSKRWKSVWLSVPILYFDDDAVQDFHSFTNFMSSTMSSRDVMLPIRSFTFKCANRSSPYDLNDLNKSVSYAVKQGRLESLNLHMPFHSLLILSLDLVKIELSPCIFTCKTLQVLNLRNIIMRDISPHYKFDLPLLKTLHWRSVLFDNYDYPIKLLSSCPVLEELHAYHSRMIYFLVENFSPVTKVLPITNLLTARICDINFPITMLTEVENLHLDTV
ncbi:putative F-box/FBD/LRR-repeat protein At5g22670 [Vicia villosa]|uniref:putative F-box/FBD/LRR-repeat protein At5g22670 n=1 Tax=Vicia villosa TaxID=3911 RepID=UPI00273CE3B4|nr:putative F-box/FBD/LRR-repeat protein At5g22670 [Vicia villosa]